jgi:hypothetical protein
MEWMKVIKARSVVDQYQWLCDRRTEPSIPRFVPGSWKSAGFSLL